MSLKIVSVIKQFLNRAKIIICDIKRLRDFISTLGFFLSATSARQEIVILEGRVLLLSWSS